MEYKIVSEYAEGGWNGMKTFTISIVPVLVKSSGKGTKNGKTVYRVRANVEDKDAALARAQNIVNIANQLGVLPEGKSEFFKASK